MAKSKPLTKADLAKAIKAEERRDEAKDKALFVAKKKPKRK